MKKAVISIDMDFFPLANHITNIEDEKWINPFKEDSPVPKYSPREYWHTVIAHNGVYDGFPGSINLVKEFLEWINNLENISSRHLVEQHDSAYSIIKSIGKIDTLYNIDNHHDLGYTDNINSPKNYDNVNESNWCMSAIKHGIVSDYVWLRNPSSDDVSLMYKFDVNDIKIDSFDGELMIECLKSVIETVVDANTQIDIILCMSPYYTIPQYWNILKYFKYDQFHASRYYDKYVKGVTYIERWCNE